MKKLVPPKKQVPVSTDRPKKPAIMFPGPRFQASVSIFQDSGLLVSDESRELEIACDHAGKRVRPRIRSRKVEKCDPWNFAS